MASLAEVRRYQYEYHTKHYPYINNWRKNPYTFLKSRFYMESSAILVLFLLKTRIRPNTVTLAYAFMGLIGGALLSMPSKTAIVIAAVIFFSKGILDWSDGHYAKVTGQTSLTGAILDPYATFLGSLGFQVGLGLYVANKSNMTFFYYLTALVPFFLAAKATSFGYITLFNEHLTREEIARYTKEGRDNPEGRRDGVIPRNGREYFGSVINRFLDDRARTVDFVCLLIIIEMISPVFITWVIFLGFVLKNFLIFAGTLYIVAKGGWAEENLRKKAVVLNERDDEII